MKFRQLDIKGVYAIDLEPRGDNRGAFARTYCREEFGAIGHNSEFVQFNQSWNLKKGTVRGMHFQSPPFKEIKLIRCIRGAVYDVLVDIRQGSETFLKHVAIELSEKNMTMLYVPEGLAHGFQSLTDDAQLLYHHTAYFKPGFEGGLHYLDPRLGIAWPLATGEISDRDRNHPFINESFKGIN